MAWSLLDSAPCVLFVAFGRGPPTALPLACWQGSPLRLLEARGDTAAPRIRTQIGHAIVALNLECSPVGTPRLILIPGFGGLGRGRKSLIFGLGQEIVDCGALDGSLLPQKPF